MVYDLNTFDIIMYFFTFDLIKYFYTFCTKFRSKFKVTILRVKFFKKKFYGSVGSVGAFGGWRGRCRDRILWSENDFFCSFMVSKTIFRVKFFKKNFSVGQLVVFGTSMGMVLGSNPLTGKLFFYVIIKWKMIKLFLIILLLKIFLYF